MKEFSGLESIFLLQLYLNPGLELMRFANLIRSQSYELEIVCYLWWSKERELVSLEGLSSGE